MIKKSFELDKINFEKNNNYLFYGDNVALKNELIDKFFRKKFSSKIFRYEESEILNDKEKFLEEILTKSFFENEKLIIITRTTDKIIEFVNEVIERNVADLVIIFLAENLDKKSKIRSLFEKDKNLICVPFYPDTYKTFLFLVSNFFKEKKIQTSQEITNLIIERSNGNRQNLKNELQKIENYTLKNKKLDLVQIKKLINLSENNNVTELVDFCLAKNKKKISQIINENNFTKEDTILIIRTFMNKTKRLIKLKDEMQDNKNVDNIISFYKPPIFWKDKEIVKIQMTHWSIKNITILLHTINDIELLMKKNYENSISILLNFIFSTCKITN